MTREFAETLNRMFKGEDNSSLDWTHSGVIVGCVTAGGLGFFINEDCGFLGLLAGLAVSGVFLIVCSCREQCRGTAGCGRIGPLSESELEKARAVLRRGRNRK